MLIANKYEKYLSMIKNKDNDFNRDDKEIFDKLRLKRYCCKRMLLTNIDLIKKIK